MGVARSRSMRTPASATVSGGMKTARAGSIGPFLVRLPPHPARIAQSSMAVLGRTPVLRPASTPACREERVLEDPRTVENPPQVIESASGRPERPPRAEGLPHRGVFITIRGLQAHPDRPGGLPHKLFIRCLTVIMAAECGII